MSRSTLFALSLFAAPLAAANPTPDPIDTLCDAAFSSPEVCVMSLQWARAGDCAETHKGEVEPFRARLPEAFFTCLVAENPDARSTWRSIPDVARAMLQDRDRKSTTANVRSAGIR